MRTYPLGMITIEGPGDHEDQVYKELDTILLNPVGKILLQFIYATQLNHIPPKNLKIVPYTGLWDNNSASPPDDRDAASPDLPDYFNDEDDDLRTPEIDERYNTSGRKGTGKGSDVKIEHSPSRYMARLPDEGLFHELVHGLREMEGAFHAIPTTKGHVDWKDEEEWLAILLTNVYTSAKPSTRLRGFNHMTWEKLEENWSTSAGLLTDDYHLTLLNIYGAMNRQLFWAIAGIPADFNPMRELYILNPKKYVGRRAAPVVPTPDRPTR